MSRHLWCSTVAIFFLLVHNLIGVVVVGVDQNAPQRQDGCAMYGVCDESSVNPGTNMTCVYNGPPKEMKDQERMETLRTICPELVEEYGTKLCCAPEQVDILQDNLALPQGIIGRCPSCFYNFRQSICELACSPKQGLYLNVTKAIKSKFKPGEFKSHSEN